MSVTARVDLALLTQNKVKMLTGHQRGVYGREFLGLDSLDGVPGPVVFVAPMDLDAITPSFVQGFLAASIQKLGLENLRVHYDFSMLPKILQDDIETGIERLLLHSRREGAN